MKHNPQSCISSFDYHGWADWNTWRREVAAAAVPGPRFVAVADVYTYAPKYQKDCSTDCGFPSECSWQECPAWLESVLEEFEERERGLWV
jgi:hypothetical protein